MQHRRRGLLPCRTALIEDEESVPCRIKEAQQQWWRKHFSKVLNLRSQFEEEVLGGSVTKGNEWEHSWKAFERKVKMALGKLKNGKAAGYSNILPEMLKAGARNKDFVSMLMELIMLCGRTDVCHISGKMPSSFLSPINFLLDRTTSSSAMYFSGSFRWIYCYN